MESVLDVKDLHGTTKGKLFMCMTMDMTNKWSE